MTTPAATAVLSPRFADMLEIHQDPWLALHFFAYNLARNRSEVDERNRVAIDPADMALVEGALAAQVAPLVAAYAPYAKMHPLFDNGLAFIGAGLAERGLEGVSDENVRRALVDFMPHYEAHFAARHRAVVSEMAARVRAQVDMHGDVVAAELRKTLGAEWGSDPIRFDLVPYVTPAGAFTAGTFRWSVISAMDSGNNDHAFEMVFHEATHMKPIGEGLQELALAALGRHGLKGQRFWHYLQFYASGEAVKKALGPDYVPYIYTQGLRHRGDAKQFYDAIEATWDQHDTLEARADAAAAWVAAKQKESQ
ncbi:hypothetical protein [Sphingomicrobium flavum]|uniref:hypothetical protein n=1 Tax=Sphingomicrobium flavum TaxID=1229164 RepID=UPI0021ADE382|nr:hypothetical protein [Sphingomicrobium flavum]